MTLPVHLSGVPQKVSVHFVSQLNISNALKKMGSVTKQTSR